jgi:hypothetical protein
MEHTVRQRRQKLEERNNDCLGYKVAHNQASEMYATRNSRLALAALVFSALTGTSAVWSALEATYFPTGGAPLPFALWGTAVTGLLTAVATGLQKTNWASLEQAKAHHETAARYDQVAREAQRTMSDASANEKQLGQALFDVDRHMDDIKTREPFLPTKFVPRPEPAAIQLNKLYDAGLVDVFETRASGEAADLLGERFQGKPQKVQILETWTGLAAQGLGTWVTQAVEDGAQVEILLLNPTSEHVKYRGQALANTGVTSADVKSNIEGDLKILGQVLGKLDQNRGTKGTLEIRVYDVTPVVNMYRFDEVRIIGTYLWAEDSITGPQFEVKAVDGDESTPLVADFNAHFKKIWDLQGEHPTKKVRVEKVESVAKKVNVTESEVIVEI